ncbi:class I SAM-dependent methyltransferase [Ornithinimicrobium kibberense]|uniref:class I SAM-dependent methyltransferase n=1 Tax=Ornithinimicrobium kibberense TaxID=282060 RepID=UPI0011445818
MHKRTRRAGPAYPRHGRRSKRPRRRGRWHTGTVDTEPTPDRVVRRPLTHPEAVRAGRTWWDAEAEAYHAEHGEFLGDHELTWCPEGWTESELGLLGDLAGARVLEVGAGAGQGARWCARRGARAVASDLSGSMLAVGARLQADLPASHRPALVQCDGTSLPFADGSFDVVLTAHGVLPFVPDAGAALREWARVLRPGGRCVFSLPHPVRWAFPDVPGPEGLRATHSYFDRRPYVEETAGGTATYSEHHRTLGDLVRAVVRAGLVLTDLLEPEWPEDADHVWGGWSATRGRLLPGTAILVCRRPRGPQETA